MKILRFALSILLLIAGFCFASYFGIDALFLLGAGLAIPLDGAAVPRL